MKRHIFLTRRAHEIERWREAFPNAEVVAFSGVSTILVAGPGEALVWVHLGNQAAPPPVARVNTLPAWSNRAERRAEEGPADLVKLAIRVAPGCSVVALSNQTSQEEGLICLEAGASGYTTALANPEVLRQIAMVVENGGLWVGPELMSRLRGSLGSLLPEQAQAVSNRLAQLSPREREVALAVGAGVSNKEVARDLGITERTVKAHLSAIFNRLNIHDRTQLILMIKGAHI